MPDPAPTLVEALRAAAAAELRLGRSHWQGVADAIDAEAAGDAPAADDAPADPSPAPGLTVARPPLDRRGPKPAPAR